ncbi:DUF3048 domain-containing protein [Streptomyces sp. NPDC051207]|uniref:DUF3048 domain-containing protein n=1 Tax=Streptomyces sp. NPDC051207 TaxID=3154641 RepID=UPI0034493D56
MAKGRGARRGRATTTAAVLAGAVTAALAAGCTSGGDPADDGRAASRGPSRGTAQTTASVLAVKIDNAPAARPHTGLEAADVVYVEPVEGGLSRLMAVYATQFPAAVGPVRSARESDLELLAQFWRPTLAFSGAQGKLKPLLKDAPLRAASPDQERDGYFREPGRAAPHNLYVRPHRLMPSAPGADALTTGFRYGAAPAGGRAEHTHTVRYPAARFTFTWSDSRDGWLVAMDGRASAPQPAPATVVVQYVTVRESAFRDFLGNNSPYTETVGSGRATVLRDGRAHDVAWKRPSATQGTSFTQADGAPVNFARGQVWVVFAQAPGKG